METYFYSEKYQRLAAITQHRIVCYDYTDRKKVDVPEQLKQAILRQESKV